MVVVLVPALALRTFASHLWPLPKQQGNRAWPVLALKRPHVFWGGRIFLGWLWAAFLKSDDQVLLEKNELKLKHLIMPSWKM